MDDQQKDMIGFLSFCPFSFGHCVVCPSSIYGIRLPIWYLETLLTGNNQRCPCETLELMGKISFE